MSFQNDHRSSTRKIRELCVIGHPSGLGGADTELDHQITCWQAMGIKVHLCHTNVLDERLRAMRMEERGCVVHEPCDWQSIAGLDCISFCNGIFLDQLPEIRRHARTTSFVNCMTWNFDREIEMQKRGLVDFHLYQTRHGFARISPALRGSAAYRPLLFTPYFHADQFPFHEHRPPDAFRFGRISRADVDKFGSRQLWIYETMTAPVLKEGLIVGWSERAREKFGRAPDSYIRTLSEAQISQQEFYAFCEATVMTSETYENLPRVGFEAMASGSILIVDDRGGWQLQVQDGVTGWLCRDDREFVYKASRCAFESDERAAMRVRGRERLIRHWGIDAASRSWECVFDEIARLR